MNKGLLHWSYLWIYNWLLVLLWFLGWFFVCQHSVCQSPLKCIFWLRYAVRKAKTVDSVPVASVQKRWKSKDMKDQAIKYLGNDQTQKKTHPRKVKKGRNWSSYPKNNGSSKNNG